MAKADLGSAAVPPTINGGVNEHGIVGALDGLDSRIKLRRSLDRSRLGVESELDSVINRSGADRYAG